MTAGSSCGSSHEPLEETKSDAKDAAHAEIGMLLEGHLDIEEHLLNHTNGKLRLELWWVDCDLVEGFKDGCARGNNGVSSASLIPIPAFLYRNSLVKVTST